MAGDGGQLTARREPQRLRNASEWLAWDVAPGSSRRFFLAVTAVVVVALLGSSVTAAWVTARNAATLSSARTNGLGIASAATDFRTSLAAADAGAATTLLAGGLESPRARDRYQRDLLLAGRALTEAALVATDEDAEDVTALADGLVRYTALVETSRANSRQGFPVGASYMAQAQRLANDDLAPRADRLRRNGEQRLARAANDVGGPLGGVAIAFLTVGVLVLLAAAVVVAGRTRRVAHPAGIVAAVTACIGLAVATNSILSQGQELRRAATTSIRAYVAANDASFLLSNLRVTEMRAVAERGTGENQYDRFRSDAEQLEDRLDRTPALAELQHLFRNYRGGVVRVEAIDRAGDNRAAAELALTGISGTAYAACDDEAAYQLRRAGVELERRFDAADSAAIPPFVPLALGVIAGGSGGSAILARGRRYR